VGFHSLTKKAGKTSGERQRDLIKLIFYFNGLIVLCVTLLEVLEVLAPGEILPATVFVVLCFNAFSYAYFHVFNMSETARRIKVLRQLYQQPGQFETELGGEYSPREMIENRLHRLVSLGEIKIDDDSTVELKRRRLLRIAKMFKSLRKVIIGMSEQGRASGN
jgi:hypothetical protein